MEKQYEYNWEKQAARLVWLRNALGLKSQSDLAMTVGIPQGNYSQMERGKRGMTVEHFGRFATVHYVNPEFFLFGDPAGLPSELRKLASEDPEFPR